MLAGHYAPVFVLHRRFSDVPLWALFLACQAVDVAFFVLVLLGIERMAMRPGVVGPMAMDLRFLPFTHSLQMTLAYGAVVVSLGLACKRVRLFTALALALTSHFLMDLLVHVHDLPITLASDATLGLGLWRFPVASLTMELGLVVAAYLWWRRGRSRALARTSDWLAGGLLLTQVIYALMPQPTDTVHVALMAEAVYLSFALWALFVGRAARRLA